MTRIALLSPTTLLGGEIRDALAALDGLGADLVLLATEDEQVGTVTQVGSAVALVSKADPDALVGADLVVACGLAADDLPLVEARAAGTTAIVASPDASAELGIPVVGDINPEAIEPGEILLSPHPVAIALSHLLAPLARFAPQSATATAVLPVSHLGGAGLDGLLEQARAILAMAGEGAEGIFGRQLAFNLYPVPPVLGGGGGVAGADRVIPELVARTTGLTMPLALRVLQGSIFHGVSVSLFVELGEPPGVDAVREALADQRAVSVVDEDGDSDLLDDPDDPGHLGVPGPVEAAVRASEVIVGAVDEVADGPGGLRSSGGRVYSLWAVMDNLSRGGAENVADIAARLFGGRSNLVS